MFTIHEKWNAFVNENGMHLSTKVYFSLADIGPDIFSEYLKI
jgi:hypothetical protein